MKILLFHPLKSWYFHIYRNLKHFICSWWKPTKLHSAGWKFRKPSLEICLQIIKLTKIVLLLTFLCSVTVDFFSLEAYRDQDPSPDHSSGSESGSDSSHSRSQSPSSSGSSSSEEEGSRTESVHAPVPSSDAPQSRTSALCLRNISLRSGGRLLVLKFLQGWYRLGFENQEKDRELYFEPGKIDISK